MSDKEFSPSKVAVIGLGTIGNAIASNLVRGNRPVIIANRNPEKTSELAWQLGRLAQPMEIADAIRDADIIVFAVWFDAIKELLKQYASDLKGKIIVDPSNPIAPDEKGGYKKIIPADQSAGKILKALIPAGAKFVKALGSLGVATYSQKAFQSPERSVLFYAADDTDVFSKVEQLINDSGFDAVRVGGTDQSIRIEVFGDLHEFGSLGKAVIFSEAEQIIGLPA